MLNFSEVLQILTTKRTFDMHFPLALGIGLLGALPVFDMPFAGRVHAAEAPPELHIHMKLIDVNGNFRQGLRLGQGICFEGKGFRPVPPAMLTPEKSYEDAGNREYDEYFSGNKYARYQTWNDYDVDENTCQITRKRMEFAEIDDGQFGYKLDLVKRTGKKYVSGAVDKPRSQDRLRSFTKEHPEVAIALGNLMVPPGQAESIRQGTTKAVTPIAVETYAGQPCDVLSMGGKNNKLCLWAKMHDYPSTMKRPIKLMIETPLPGGLGVPQGSSRGEASEFEIGKKITADKFKPPVGITLR